MKRFVFLWVATLCLAVCLAVVVERNQARGQGQMPENASPAVGLFYDALLPYGEWLWTASCGWVWAPYDTPIDWRPYSDGHWVDTADYGYYWQSGEPWSWACYHYGRWFNDADYGWVWCPTDVWGPAWVAWADTDDTVGWCPLPPRLPYDEGVGFNLAGVNLYDRCPSFGFSFCHIDDFLRPDLDDCLFPFHRNAEFLKDCRLRVGIGYDHHRIFDRLPFEDRFEKRLGHPIEKWRTSEVRSVGDLHAPGLGRNEIRIFRTDRAAVAEGRARWKPSIASLPPVRHEGAVKGGREVPVISIPRQPDIIRRQTQELHALNEQHHTWQNWLQEQHHSELAHPPTGLGRDQLLQRQHNETNFLNQQFQREQRNLQTWHQRERWSTPPSFEVPHSRFHVSGGGESTHSFRSFGGSSFHGSSGGHGGGRGGGRR